ncbi:MAG: hypothetical protein N4A40_10090 [Tissierellales bacterium]|jgi:hypothetical protein|nr:hypothetical protein [Tissierellales bacterium]
MKLNVLKNEMLEELKSYCESKNIKASMDVYLAMLLIGSEKLSVSHAAEILPISENELIGALNKFNIHHASI